MATGLDDLAPGHRAFPVKTSLRIDDQLMRRLRDEAARQGKTISEIVETALRPLLAPAPRRSWPARFPTGDLVRAFVDVSDREALYRAMEGRSSSRRVVSTS